MQVPTLHYERAGDPSGAPIVFLHGFMGNASDWRTVVSHLARRHYCISIDLPGHGRSLNLRGEGGEPIDYSLPTATAGLMGVMKSEGLAPATLVGYSMGGRVALYLAVRHREACSRLVIVSATPGIADPDQRRHRLKRDRKLARELEEEGLVRFLHRWYRQPLFETIADSPSRLESLVLRRSANRPSELAKALTGMSVGGQRPLWTALPGLDMPVLVLAGQQDAKYVEIVQAMGASLPDSRVEIIPDCGHVLHLEDPSGVARRIEDFVSN